MKYIKIRKRTAIIILIAVLVVLFGYRMFSSPNGEQNGPNQAKIRTVDIASVAELSEDKAPLPLLGEVKSRAEVTIRAESQGIIKGVYRSQGQFVGAGSIIAEVDNARERAALLQAQGAVAQAEAGISIFEIQSGSAESLYNEAKRSTVNTIQSAYTVADDVMRSKVDQFFSNSQTNNPKILTTQSTTKSKEELDLEWSRFVIEEMLDEWEVSLDELTVSSDLFAHLAKAEENLILIRDFLNDASPLINSLTPHSTLSQTTIDIWKGAVVASRTSINSTISSISLANDNLTSKKSALEIAKQQGQEGSTEIQQGEAALLQAQGSLKAAEANLEKTIIRAPISGTLNKLSIEKGDFVTVFEEVAIVSNNSALEIISYITEEDRKTIKVGADVIIDQKYNGVVSEIAPAIDKETKKIELKIAIEGGAETLSNGESVEISIVRTYTETVSSGEIVIPITALKVETDNVLVFTVEDGILRSHVVTLGPIVSDKIMIDEGLTPDMKIVVDARGLKEGDSVTVRGGEHE